MDNASLSSAAPVHPTLGVFVTRPWARFLVGAFLPWVTASVLAITIWPLVPYKAVYYGDHVMSQREIVFGYEPRPRVQLSFAERKKYFCQGLILLPAALIPPSLILGTTAKFLLRLLAPRTALVWRGRLLAGICVFVGMVIGIPVMAFYEYAAFSSDEHHLALCAQWDSNDGEWLDDPRCGFTRWHWALTLIPGGGAGLVYWFVRLRPRQ